MEQTFERQLHGNIYFVSEIHDCMKKETNSIKPFQNIYDKPNKCFSDLTR